MSNALKNAILEYIVLNKKIDSLSKTISNERKRRKDLESKIVKYLKENKMDKSKINTGSYSLKCVENKTPGNLSMSLVFDTLCNMLDSEEKAQEICDTIQEIRDENSKVSIGIKLSEKK